MRARRPSAWTLGTAIAALVLLATPLLAQRPTADLKGRVRDQSGAALPGVTVTVTSPALQGTRTTQTNANGDYIFPFLPPGQYRTSYELEGFATAVREIAIQAAQTEISDVSMQLSEVVEEIVITSSLETVSETSAVSQTYSQDELEKLAIGREPFEAVGLAPGVANTGPSSEPSIHGAMTFENLYLVNGVVVNDNVRGQFLDLYVEDAVQETTVATAGVSAEFGRFTGGVVNVLTKSGGNEFDGSIRASFDNQDWESTDVREELDPSFEAEDKINKTYEVTFGGPIWRDRIWFFTAGRDRGTDGTDTTDYLNIPFSTTDEERRLEGKLTLGITPSHSIIGTYLDIERDTTNSHRAGTIDLRSLTDRSDPQTMKAGNYTGILTATLFAEAQYSEREWSIGVGNGGPSGDLVNGTFIFDAPTGYTYWSPLFCGDCGERLRNNESYLAKGSYFLTTSGVGTHDLTFGYENFSDIRSEINHQSGSDFHAWADDTVIGNDGTLYPVFSGGLSWLFWWPIAGLDVFRPTDYETRSAYLNDVWQLNDNWSFNVGFRYDQNHGVDSSGALVADDDKISPRLGTTWDIKGNGDLVLNASYGTYVAGLSNPLADGASSGGALGAFIFRYLPRDAGGRLNVRGTPINANCQPDGTNCVTADVAIQQIFDWYFANGGIRDDGQALGGFFDANHPLRASGSLFYSSIPGVTSVIREGITSPSADEVSVGIIKRLGSKGLLRADVVYREWQDFYSDRTQVGDIAAGTDVIEIGNFGNDFLERDYIGVDLSARFRVSDRLTLAGNYTWSKLEGNINGETAGSGPVSVSPSVYPEYADLSWNLPVGRLTADQTHKLRAWAVYDIVDTEHHNLNVSLLQNFFSGQPYGAFAGIDTNPYVVNPGYANPPATVNYFFTARDEFETDDITRTDVALNYAFRWNLFGRAMEVYFQPEVINLFDEDGVTNVLFVNQTVYTNVNDVEACGGGTVVCAPFNPFTETPVEGVHWAKDPEFGEATGQDAFQQPRTFRFSIGFRF